MGGPSKRAVAAVCAATVVGVAGMGLGGCGRSADPVAGEAATEVESAGSRTKATQVAARVNGQEVTVHQVNDRLAVLPVGAGAGAGGGGSGTAEAPPPERALRQLIELTLIEQEAKAQGLEQDPAVLRQLQLARLDVLARAWAQQLGDEDAPITPEEMRRYYDDHPAWFAQRRVFHVQDLRCEGGPAADGELGRSLGAVRHPEDVQRLMVQAGHRCRLTATHLGGEQIPAELHARLMQLQPGQSVAVPAGPAARWWWLQARLEQPISWSQAQPLIERGLSAQRRGQRVRQELERLRTQARIEYLGDFSHLGAQGDTTPR